jgi:hypothetical protein
MPQCVALTNRLIRCTRNAIEGHERCRQHQTIVDRNPGVPAMEELIRQNQPEFRGGHLADFARDKQNVHKKKTVDMVKKTVKLLLSMEHCDYPSKTIFTELITACPLTIRAIVEFTKRYWDERETIYDMGPGIYFKITNALWHYTLHSPHKKDICSIIATEIDDSVGMCAQGALSRLCNVLSGYLEGVSITRSTSEELGDAFSKLASNDTLNLYSKLNKAREVLIEHDVQRDQWDDWLDPLVEEGEQDWYSAWKLSLNN